MDSLACRLQAARIVKGLTQTALAKRSGVSLKNISLIENNHRTDIKRETATKLAAVLGCTVEWLVLGTGRSPCANEAA